VTFGVDLGSESDLVADDLIGVPAGLALEAPPKWSHKTHLYFRLGMADQHRLYASMAGIALVELRQSGCYR
jgi:hypothetical protein